jgi:YVTN family beta-propeller protein
VYVTSEAGDLVHAIDADSGKITGDLVAGLRPRRIAATPDGKELWVTAELSGEVDIVDRSRFVVTGTIAFLPPGMRKADVTPVGLTMTKDGKTAYVTLGHAAHVAIVNVPTRKVLGYILVGKRAWGITLSRDARTLYVANGLGDDVTVIDTKTRKAVISVPVGRVPYGVVVDE